MFKIFLKFVFTPTRLLWLLVLWQLISVLLMALGVWPDYIAWVNVALTAIYIVWFDTHYGLLLLITSIPFFVVVPNAYLDSLPSWRLLFAWLFAVWLVRAIFNQRKYLTKIKHFRQMYREAAILEQSKLELLWTLLRRIDSRFMPWDKYAALFLLVALLSTIFARYPIISLKHILFLINVYLIYIVSINVITTRERLEELIKHAAASTAIIVALGYIQFAATLFVPQYYFWQYWAVMVSRLYYGLPLANVLIYSNSWFSYTSGAQELRMFSIMPDSHSFAMIAVFCIGFLLALVMKYKPYKWNKMYIWHAIRFSGLAVVLSGTRGIWVGMIPPLLLTCYFYLTKFSRPLVKKLLMAQLLIILFFLLSPLINLGLHALRVSQYKENFLDRAQSIYDLSEGSNKGRLIIWRDSATYALTHPFGVGYGNFVVSLVHEVPENTPYEEIASERNLRYNLPQKFVSAHSLYLNIIVELGFAGLLVFAIFWWEYLAQVWRFVRQYAHQDNIFTMFVFSLGVIMVWFLAYGVFDVTMFNDRVLMYIFISLGITGIILRRYESFEESREPKGQT